MWSLSCICDDICGVCFAHLCLCMCVYTLGARLCDLSTCAGGRCVAVYRWIETRLCTIEYLLLPLSSVSYTSSCYSWMLNGRRCVDSYSLFENSVSHSASH